MAYSHLVLQTRDLHARKVISGGNWGYSGEASKL